jgi:serine/threonine protein kinase
VIREKKLPEIEALVIFRDIVRTVRDIHTRNIVHRDLKLGNMVLNEKTKEIIITNFCLGKHLLKDDELLVDQRGSPAYISPDVLSDAPYCGKASDMWALGVVLYTMLFGIFPFYHSVPAELFRKIKAVEYSIPRDVEVSPETVYLIQHLLSHSPSERFNADRALDYTSRLIQKYKVHTVPFSVFVQLPYYARRVRAEQEDDQVVPNIPIDDTEESNDGVAADKTEQNCRDQSKEVTSVHTRVDTMLPVPCWELVAKGKKRKRRVSERGYDCMIGKETVGRVGGASKVPQIVATKSTGILISRVGNDSMPLTDKELELVRRLT